MKNTQPDYKAIYKDILNKEHPEKKEECEKLLRKEHLSVLNIIELNRKIFGTSDKETKMSNQRRRSYNPTDILQILEYQKKNKLNNVQLASHFGLSRNTVAKWKKIFEV